MLSWWVLPGQRQRTNEQQEEHTSFVSGLVRSSLRRPRSLARSRAHQPTPTPLSRLVPLRLRWGGFVVRLSIMDALAPLLEPIDNLVASSVAASGLAEDQVKYIYCLLFAVPFGWLFRVLPNVPALKHVLSIVISIILCSWTLGQYSWVHAVVSSLISWLLVRLLPARHAPTAVMCFAMAYMSVRYATRATNPPTTPHDTMITNEAATHTRVSLGRLSDADGCVGELTPTHSHALPHAQPHLPHVHRLHGLAPGLYDATNDPYHQAHVVRVRLR